MRWALTLPSTVGLFIAFLSSCVSLTHEGSRTVFLDQSVYTLEIVARVERECKLITVRDGMETGPRDKRVLRNYMGTIGANVAIAVETSPETRAGMVVSGSKSRIQMYACPKPVYEAASN